jgi:hypothetical protein
MILPTAWIAPGVPSRRRSHERIDQAAEGVALDDADAGLNLRDTGAEWVVNAHRLLLTTVQLVEVHHP